MKGPLYQLINRVWFVHAACNFTSRSFKRPQGLSTDHSHSTPWLLGIPGGHEVALDAVVVSGDVIADNLGDVLTGHGVEDGLQLAVT